MKYFKDFLEYSVKSVFLENHRTFYKDVFEKMTPKIKDLKTYLTTHYKTKDSELKKLDPSLTGVKVGSKNYRPVETIFDLIRGYYKDKKIDYNLPGYYFYEYDSTLEDDWLIHFSDKADLIYSNQEFKYGVSDINYIAKAHLAPKDRGLTTPNGYNFAFSMKDIIASGLGYVLRNKILKLSNDGKAYLIKLGNILKIKNRSLYGANAVVFFVPAAVRIYAPQDKQYQMIFFSTEASHINLIVNEEGLWKIKNKSQTEVVFQSENIKDLLKDFKKNYTRFKKELF